MLRRDGVVIGAALLVLIALGGALAMPGATPGGSVPPPSSPAPMGPRLVREGIVGSIDTLDPLFARNRAELDLDALIFSGLTRLGADGRVVGDLAERWTVSGKGLVYTFTIRRNAMWHDGVPVTADDVVFTILTIQHPDYTGPLAGTWRGVTAQRLDARTVRFRLVTAAANFLVATTQPILPSHLLVGQPISRLATSSFGRDPIGSGPFRLSELDGAHALLERAVPAVATPARTTPARTTPAPSPVVLPDLPLGWRLSSPAAATSVDEFDVTFFADAAGLAAAFRSGAIDAAGGLDPATATALARQPGVTMLQYPRTVLTSVMLNVRFGQNLFRDARVRRALLLAIDRDKLVRDVLKGAAVRADTLIPPSSWAFDAKAAGHVPRDPAAAVKALKAAGWRRQSDGWIRPGADKPVTIELLSVDAATNPVDSIVAARIAADWTRIGLHVKVTRLPINQMVGVKLVPGRYDAAVVDVNLGLDPDLYPLLASGQSVAGGGNVSGYQSATLDPLLEAARIYASTTTRLKRFSALQAQLGKELPILPLFYADYLYVVRDTIQGPSPTELSTAADRFWDVLTWRVAEPVGR